jgi:tetratricopeptide (TPR) repeat protein
MTVLPASDAMPSSRKDLPPARVRTTPEPGSGPGRTTPVFLCAIPLLAMLALVTLVYANHFHNDFHFDDFHTITSNPYIRDLRNIPRFFTDADTFSTLPANRSWRPLVSTSLAIDYWLGKGLKPLWFQSSTFFWFLVQLVLMFSLFRHILNATNPGRPDSDSGILQPVPGGRGSDRAGYFNFWVALFATTLYGVHPAVAETINYAIQRGDVYSTLAVVAGLWVYVRWPERRKQCLYLIPVALGLLSKPPTLIFPVILFAYLMLFEDSRPAAAMLRCVPALVVSAVFGALSAAMTPKSYSAGAGPAYDYRITQPLVALRYFRNFFQPLYLSADTDHVADSGIFHGYAWLGILFVAALIAAAVWCGRRRVLRPIAFGIYWYILALIPTSVFALAEVENDHRMFFPFAGLSLSVCYAAALLYSPRTREQLMLTGAACAVILCAAGYGTWERNIVWRNEENLWRDVTLKSPKNGRGLMNYGLTQMGKGDYIGALSYFNRAVEFNPSYYVLEINLGIANAALHRDDEAERHYLRSVSLAPNDAQTLYFYAAWLRDHHRASEAVRYLETTIARNPDYMDGAYLLMSIYADSGDTANVQRVARQVLAEFPNDAVARARLAGKLP